MGLGDLFKKCSDTKLRTLYEWECVCGARSRGGDISEHQAKYLAEQHQWRSGIGHPMPEIHDVQVEVPSDWP